MTTEHAGTAADLRFSNDEAGGRYEARLGGTLVGVCDYRIDGGTMLLPHTETMPAYRGRGFADALVTFVLDDARRRGLRVDPQCWFVRDFIRAHPEYADLARAG